MTKPAKIGVLGASGYTGSECVRLLLRHPQVEIALLTADRKAGQEMREVFAQFSPYALPKLVPLDGLDWPAPSGAGPEGRGRRGRTCCSRKCRKGFTPMASATTATWPNSTRNSPPPPGVRSPSPSPRISFR